MARASAAQTLVSYVAEATIGTTPTSPTLLGFRASGESLMVDRKHAFVSELNGKRGERNHIITGKSGSGGLTFNWSDATLEDFLESALRAAWATDVLTSGNTPKAFTVETKFETGATDVYKRLLGAQINTLSINAPAQEVITGAVEFMALDGAATTTAISGATYSAANTEAILAGDSVGSLALSGLTIDAMPFLTLNINNNLSPRLALGQLAPVEHVAGKLEVSGTVGLYLSDTEVEFITAALAGTATAFTFRLGTTTGKITEFSIPNVRLMNPKWSAESADGDVLLNLDWRGLQASGISNEVIQVTRNIA